MIQYEEREKIKRMPTSAHTAHSRDIDKNSARDRGKIADFSVFAFLWYKNIHSQFSVQHTSLSPVYPFVHIPHRACGISGVRRRYLCSTCTRKVFNSICSLFYCCVLWIRYSVSCLGRTIARSHNNKQTKYETRREWNGSGVCVANGNGSLMYVWAISRQIHLVARIRNSMYVTLSHFELATKSIVRERMARTDFLGNSRYITIN